MLSLAHLAGYWERDSPYGDIEEVARTGVAIAVGHRGLVLELGPREAVRLSTPEARQTIHSPHAKARLRTLCAWFASRAVAIDANPALLYGGEGLVTLPEHFGAVGLYLAHSNTTDAVWMRLRPAETPG